MKVLFKEVRRIALSSQMEAIMGSNYKTCKHEVKQALYYFFIKRLAYF